MKIGWKHGRGGMEGAKRKEIEKPAAKGTLLAAMVALGCFALWVPAWLTNVRKHDAIGGIKADLVPAPETAPASALYEGVRTALGHAIDGLRKGDRAQAAVALVRRCGWRRWALTPPQVGSTARSSRSATRDSRCSREVNPERRGTYAMRCPWSISRPLPRRRCST